MELCAKSVVNNKCNNNTKRKNCNVIIFLYRSALVEFFFIILWQNMVLFRIATFIIDYFSRIIFAINHLIYENNREKLHNTISQNLIVSAQDFTVSEDNENHNLLFVIVKLSPNQSITWFTEPADHVTIFLFLFFHPCSLVMT